TLARPQAARLPLRRPDRLLLVHAGRRARERPHDRLLPVRAAHALASACSRSAHSSSTSSSPTESRSRPGGIRSPSQRCRLSMLERTPPRLVWLTISRVEVSTARGSATSNEISPEKPG